MYNSKLALLQAGARERKISFHMRDIKERIIVSTSTFMFFCLSLSHTYFFFLSVKLNTHRVFIKCILYVNRISFSKAYKDSIITYE